MNNEYKNNLWVKQGILRNQETFGGKESSSNHHINKV